MTHPTSRLTFDGVNVDFGASRALDGIDLQFAAGEIVGLLGHNGAGKSTLVNVATGSVRPSGGRILLDGEPINADTPRRAAELGITVVHQTPALAGNLSILDNLFLGSESTGRNTSQRAQALAALAQVGGDDLPLETQVGSLPLGKRQIIDLARGLLSGKMRVLLLDEPTAALGQGETDALHTLIRRLAADGTTVIYVSHRLPDIVEVCDRIVILRDGRVAGGQPVAGLSSAELARTLAPDLAEDAYQAPNRGAEVLRITGTEELRFHAGEVVGMFGVAGGEQFALLNALQGRDGRVSGARLNGHPYQPRSPHAAITSGVHTVAADRDRDGLIAGLSAIDNVFLPWRGRRVDGRPVAASARSRAEQYTQLSAAFNIHGPGPDSPVSTFSGGNRQKHLIASWVTPVSPTVLLLAQPTQGVDVGAKVDIRREIRRVAAEGAAVVVASAESDEIAGMCDRSYVLSGGRAAEVARSADFGTDLLQTLLDLIPPKGALT